MEKVLDYKSSNTYYVLAKVSKYKNTDWEIYNFFNRYTLKWDEEAGPETLFYSKEDLTKFRNKNRSVCKGGNMRPVWTKIEGI